MALGKRLIPTYQERALAIGTALGKIPADLVLRGANLVNVLTCEVESNVDIAVKGRIIARVGRCDDVIGLNTKVVDLSGRYVAPGLVDAHLHIESSLLTPTRFCKAVIPHGTTCIFVDPHEIGNVLGVEGIREFMNECAKCPIKIFTTVPSCIPACKLGLETSPSKLYPEDVDELLDLEGAIALGEVMDDLSVLNADADLIRSIELTQSRGIRVCGHAPGLRGNELSAYLVAGPSSDHEVTSSDEAIEKVRRGMYVMIRLGTFSQDMYSIVPKLPKSYLDSGLIMFVSDDLNVIDVMHRGHMDYIIREAVRHGVDPLKAVRLCTLEPVRYYGLDWILGSVSPGKICDLVVVDSLERFNVEMVFIDGKLKYDHGKILVDIPQHSYPGHFYKTVKLPERLSSDSFKVRASVERGAADVNVIELVRGSILTKHVVEELPVENFELKLRGGFAKISVIERHGRRGTLSVGVVKGYPIRSGAIASTISHDAHNVVVIGVDDRDMYVAVRELERIGGGIVLAEGGSVISRVELPIAGLMSDREPEDVAKMVEDLLRKWSSVGGVEDVRALAPLFTMSLVVIPEIRITDLGIVDVVHGKIIDLIVSVSKR